MRQMDRYLGRSLLTGAALALLALAAMDGMISLVDEIKDVDDGYTLLDAICYTGLMMVAGVYELLPVAVLIGAVISLGNLAAQSELVAFRAIRYSRARITASVLITGTFLMLFTFLLGETAVPAAVGKAYEIKHEQEPQQRSFETAGGRWLRDGRNFIHIGKAVSDDLYDEVRVYQLNEEHHLARIVEARRAQATPEEWVLSDVRLSELSGEEVSIVRRDGLRLPRAAPRGIEKRAVSEWNPAEMNIVQLIDYVEFLRNSRLSGARAELALWTRFSAALSILVMLLLAMPWIFFSTRSTGSGKRLFFAIMIGLSYMIGSRIIGDAAVVYQIPPAIGAFLPVVLFAAAGAFALKRLQSD